MASSGEKNGPSGKSKAPAGDPADVGPAGAGSGDDDGSDDTKVSNPEDLLGSDFADSSHAATAVAPHVRERLARLQQKLSPRTPLASGLGDDDAGLDEGEATIAQADITLGEPGSPASGQEEDEDDRTAPGARPPSARADTETGDSDEEADSAGPDTPLPAPLVAYPVQSGPPAKHYPDVSPNRDKRSPAPSPPPSHGPVAVDYPRVSRDGQSGYRHYSMPVGADRPAPPPPPMAATPSNRRRLALAMLGSGAGGVVLGLVIGLAIGGGGGPDGAGKVVSASDAVPPATAVYDAMAAPLDSAAPSTDAAAASSDAASCTPGRAGCAELPPTREGAILARATGLDRPVRATVEAPIESTVVRRHAKDQQVVTKGDKLFTLRAAARRARPRQRTIEAPVDGVIALSVERGKDVDEGAVLAVVLDPETWLVSVDVASDAVRPKWSCLATTPDQTHRAPCQIDSTERVGNRSRVDVRIRSADAPWLIVPDHPLVIELAPSS